MRSYASRDSVNAADHLKPLIRFGRVTQICPAITYQSTLKIAEYMSTIDFSCYLRHWCWTVLLPTIMTPSPPLSCKQIFPVWFCD